MKPIPRPRFECPHCLDTGVTMTRDDQADACGRCARVAEAEFRHAKKQPTSTTSTIPFDSGIPPQDRPRARIEIPPL